jgi:rRNA-processing protein FCF1
VEAILDGSFMLNAVKNKIEFIDQLEALGFVPKVPKEVIDELKDSHSTARFASRAVLGQLLELLDKRGVKRTSLGKGKVDEQLLKLGKEGKYIATMDASLRRMVPNKLILSVAQKQVVVERS